MVGRKGLQCVEVGRKGLQCVVGRKGLECVVGRKGLQQHGGVNGAQDHAGGGRGARGEERRGARRSETEGVRGELEGTALEERTAVEIVSETSVEERRGRKERRLKGETECERRLGDGRDGERDELLGGIGVGLVVEGGGIEEEELVGVRRLFPDDGDECGGLQ